MLGDSLDREKDIGGLRSQERVKDEKRERERGRDKVWKYTEWQYLMNISYLFREDFLYLWLYVPMNNMAIRRETNMPKLVVSL